MSYRFATFAATLGLVAALAPPPAAATNVGEKAPAFTNVTADGKSYDLASLKGKWVVLEWYNPGCPFVRKHYESGNMPKLQQEWTGKGVVWLSVATTTPAAEAADYAKSKMGAASGILLDSQAATSIAFGAKTTPHMYVIDPEGVVVYSGAIDDNSSPDAREIPASKNYVAAALTEGMAGKKITTSATRPYGCGVKFPAGVTSAGE